MKLVAVTQRVEIITQYNEHRDCLDQQWAAFLHSCGIIPIVIPNKVMLVSELVKEIPINGVILTGGNDLAVYGGNSPERDETETLLLRYAISHAMPIMGVCRGMQVIQHHFGVALSKVPGHVSPKQIIEVSGRAVETNSYHTWGAMETVEVLQVWAQAGDGVIKAIKHKTLPIIGIMWHPERNEPFHTCDIDLFKNFFIRQDKGVDSTCER